MEISALTTLRTIITVVSLLNQFLLVFLLIFFVAGPVPTWKTCGALRGHADDVHDLAWSPDGSALVSGGVENICILWDVDAKRGMVGVSCALHCLAFYCVLKKGD